MGDALHSTTDHKDWDQPPRLLVSFHNGLETCDREKESFLPKRVVQRAVYHVIRLLQSSGYLAEWVTAGWPPVYPGADLSD